jgi:hypothetical protein
MNKCDRILSHKTKKIGSVTLIFNAKVKVASLKRKLKEHFQYHTVSPKNAVVTKLEKIKGKLLELIACWTIKIHE